MLRLEDIFTKEFKQYDCETKREILYKIFMKDNTQTLQRIGLEFCYIYGFFEILEDLIAKNKQSPDQDNREWARIYEILLDIQRGKQQFRKWLDELKQMNHHEPETVCLIQLTELNIKTRMNNMDASKSSFHTFYQNYKRMEDRLLAFYFSLRFRSYKMRYSFEHHELIGLRMTAYAIFKETDVPTITVITHIFLGASYIADSYDKVIAHLRIAHKESVEHQLVYLQRAIEESFFPFIETHEQELKLTLRSDSFPFEFIESTGGKPLKPFAILDRFPMDRLFTLMEEK